MRQDRREYKPTPFLERLCGYVPPTWLLSPGGDDIAAVIRWEKRAGRHYERLVVLRSAVKHKLDVAEAEKKEEYGRAYVRASDRPQLGKKAPTGDRIKAEAEYDPRYRRTKRKLIKMEALKLEIDGLLRALDHQYGIFSGIQARMKNAYERADLEGGLDD